MFKGLKSRVAVLLFILLSLAMCTITVVILSLWKKDLLTREIKYVSEIVVNIGSYRATGENELLAFESFENQFSRESVKICHYRGKVDNEPVKKFVGDQGLKFVTNQLNSVSQSNKTVRVNINGDLKKLHILTYPVFEFDNKRIVIAVIDLGALYQGISRNTFIIFVYILINAIALSVVGFFRMVKHIIKPIDTLVDVTDSYMLSGEWMQTGPSGANEFSRLSLALSSMLKKIDQDKAQLSDMIKSLEKVNHELKQSQQQMVRAEKIAAMGRLSAGLAHEIGNPLSIISGYLELLEDESLSSHDKKEFVGRAIKELDRINGMIKQLMNCSRSSSEDKQAVSAKNVCDEVVTVLKSHKPARQYLISTQYEADNDIVSISSNDLYQVLINGLLNSIDALKEREFENEHGRIDISTTNVTQENGQKLVQIEIKDNGVGVKKADIESVFDPFFTTKEVGKGTGLGLAVSYAIVENAGGKMNIICDKTGETRLIISLPNRD